MAEYCETCQFFDRTNVHGGDCRRRSPVTSAVKPEGGWLGDPVWPRVFNRYWCGDYVARQPARVAAGES